MAQIQISVGYRPLRIGWCIREGDLVALEKALRLTHTLWGGSFNPLIVVDDETRAGELIKLFKLDTLFAINSDTTTSSFIDSRPEIRWPVDWDELFIDRENLPTVLDVVHPIFQLAERHQSGISHQGHGKPTFFEWDDSDQLSSVFLATFGQYPKSSDIGADYGDIFKRTLEPDIVNLSDLTELPAKTYEIESPNAICSVGLEPDYLQRFGHSMDTPGLFVGSATNFKDLISFWNLRCSGTQLMFYDETFSSRLRSSCIDFVDQLQKRRAAKSHLDPFTIWFSEPSYEGGSALHESLQRFPHYRRRCHSNDAVWNGLNVMPDAMTFGERVMLLLTDELEGHSTSFQLPEFPFKSEREDHTQHFVLTTRIYGDISRRSEHTFRVPYLPELNEFIGRETATGMYWKKCRIQKHGIDYVIAARSNIFHLKPLEIGKLVHKVFDQFGIESKPSKPGLIVSRLIKQMDGLQGCRIFKISGVRRLVREYSPQQSFTKGAAVKQIGNVDENNKPHFESYEDLFIGQGRKNLTPAFTFQKLLEKQVFRVGLEIMCPMCELDFWCQLDSLKTMMSCEYCGSNFNTTLQLKDRDWRFRPNGLFARGDHQEGAIPVAVTLQQLETHLLMGFSAWHVFHSALELESKGAPISRCETDLFLLGMDEDRNCVALVGECKGQGTITEDDVTKLVAVADSFPSEQVKVFIVFSKLGEFSPKELEICAKAQARRYPRVILLTPDQLEPYEVYEKHRHLTDEVMLDNSLEYMAEMTKKIFY